MNKTVSVIVPTYNGSKTLARTVDSLLKQTLKNMEIILTDDCSTDNTRDIIEKYCQENPESVISNPMSSNTRGSGLINRSIEIARGKYVAIVDQDDWVDETMFQKLFLVAEREEADLADCNIMIVDPNGKPIRIETSNREDQVGIIDKNKRKTLFVSPGWRLSKIFRRDFLLKYKIEHCDGICFGDNYFAEHVVAYCSKIAKVDEALYYYRFDTGSITRSYNNPILYDRVKSAELMLESLKERGFLNRDFKDEIEFRFVELFYVNSIKAFLVKFDPPELKQLEYLRNRIRNDYPDYRKNPYFSQRIAFKNRLLSRMNDISPKMLCRVYRVARPGLERLGLLH